MSDQPITLNVTRDQLHKALLILDSDFDSDQHGSDFGVDLLLHALDPKRYPVHPADAPAAVAAGPAGFQVQFPGSPYYSRPGDPFMLQHRLITNQVLVLGPQPFPGAGPVYRPVVHSVAVINGDLDDAIAAAAAAVDHMAGRGR